MQQKIALFLSLLILTCVFSFDTFSQEDRGYHFGHNFAFQETSLDERFMVEGPGTYMISDTDVSYILTVFSRPKQPWDVMSHWEPRSPIILGVKLNPLLENYYNVHDVRSITKSFAGYGISDSSAAIVIAMGITRENAKDYQYHVIQDDSLELVHWTPVTDLQQNYGAKRPYAFLGKYSAPGHQLIIEVVNTHNYSIREGLVFDWRKDRKPLSTQIVVMKPGNRYFNINFAKLNSGYATQFDQTTGLPLDMHFPVDTVESMAIYFSHHESVAYSIYLISEVAGKKDTTLLEWYHRDESYSFPAKYYNKPGKYTLVVQRCGTLGSYKEDMQMRIPFEVQPPPPITEKKVSLKQVLSYGGSTLAVLALGFTGYYRLNKRKLKIAAQQKQAISLQLRSIRSQLNPHFLFNALGSIQGLMNNQDIAGANHYLTKFADLTRKVLETGAVDMISLAEELTLSSNYLEMEKLRFGFEYVIHVDVSINQDNIEIPPMLLQPFLENAVKHGVASLREQGKIQLSVTQSNKDLVFTIVDNGKGFYKERNGDQGFGLKLSGQRIVLLNQEHPDQPCSLTIDSNNNGTTVTLKMENWV